ncbi:MAG: transposase [Paracoccus hibiscisoli]|uniref:transposase n=1 Tax=Paracoccus hibiscisoli TaxID=2023261 RepID=UPI00391CC927
MVPIETRHPSGFTSSKWRSLTPARNQSGDRDISGRISKAGHGILRRALSRAATIMMHGGNFPDDCWPLDMAETMGSANSAPRRCGTGHGGPCPAHQRDPAPDSD